MGAAAKSLPQSSSTPYSGRRKPPATAGEPRILSTRHSQRFLARRPRSYCEAGPDDNYTRVPHHFFALAGREIFSGTRQMSLIGLIMGRTWGDEVKVPWVMITASEVARELACNQRTAERILADSVKRGLLERKGVGKRCAYRALPEGWNKVPKYEAEADAPEADAPEADAPEADAPEADAPEADAPKLGERIVLAPGKHVHRTPLQFTVPGVANPVQARIDCQNVDPELALAFTVSGGAKGVFRVTASRAGITCSNRSTLAGKTDGEQKAQRYRSVDRSSGLSKSSTFVEIYRPAVASLLRAAWGSAPDDDLLARVVAAAGDAPVAYFEARVALKRAKLSTLEPGILIWCAQRAAADYAAHRSELARTEARDSSAAAGVSSDPNAALREYARLDPDDYERDRKRRAELGETWPTLEELGVTRG